MTFQEIFNNEGRYKADSFQKGVCFKIDREGFLSILTYSDKNDLLPIIERPVIYKGLFDKEFVKVLNINQLFE